MAAFDWQRFLRQWSRQLLADDQSRADVPADVVASGWLGYPGATEEQIVQAERHLGTTLPPSYRAFLQATNGWRHTGPFVSRLWSTEEIAWYHVRHQDLIDGWIEGERYMGGPIVVPDDEYFVYGDGQATEALRSEYLQTALEISDEETSDACVYLLNPNVVTPDGEWEAWFLAPWLPGAVRYRSFQDMMQAESRMSLRLRNVVS